MTIDQFVKKTIKAPILRYMVEYRDNDGEHYEEHFTKAHRAKEFVQECNDNDYEEIYLYQKDDTDEESGWTDCEY